MISLKQINLNDLLKTQNRMIEVLAIATSPRRRGFYWQHRGESRYFVDKNESKKYPLKHSTSSIAVHLGR
jgi:hypothetical protein